MTTNIKSENNKMHGWNRNGTMHRHTHNIESAQTRSIIMKLEFRIKYDVIVQS